MNDFAYMAFGQLLQRLKCESGRTYGQLAQELAGHGHPLRAASVVKWLNPPYNFPSRDKLSAIALVFDTEFKALQEVYDESRAAHENEGTKCKARGTRKKVPGACVDHEVTYGTLSDKVLSQAMAAPRSFCPVASHVRYRRT